MKGRKFTAALCSLTKSLQQAQGRVLDAEHNAFRRLPRWPSRDELHIVLTQAAVMQWKMERIQNWAERHFTVMNADGAF